MHATVANHCPTYPFRTVSPECSEDDLQALTNSFAVYHPRSAVVRAILAQNVCSFGKLMTGMGPGFDAAPSSS